MNRSLVCASSASLCLVFAACGTEQRVDLDSPEVALHELDLSPGCFAPKRFSEPAPPPISTMYLQQLEMMVQQANLLLWPVREDPTASHWEVSHSAGSRIEGTIVARGSDWGALRMVLIAEQAGTSLHADVSYDPTRTTIDFTTGTQLTQTANTIRSSDVMLGCDPDTEWSFLSTPGYIECWDASGNPPAVTSTGTSGPTASVSSMMQCSQLAFKVMSR